MTGVGDQSQRVRGQTKKRLSHDINDIQRYPYRKGITESRREMMRMPLTAMGMVIVGILWILHVPGNALPTCRVIPPYRSKPPKQRYFTSRNSSIP